MANLRKQVESIEGKRIVVAITTRNRPEVFDVCLAHFKTFRSTSLPTTYLILDDESSEENRALNEAVARRHGFWDNYQYVEPRMGIARAKNECLRRSYDAGDFFFLFDDDAFPRKAGWERLYIDKSVTHQCHHLLYCADVGPYVTVGDTHGISEYNAPLGVLMFMTKKCLEVVGGFNEDFGIYGNEHIKYTNRVHASGLTNGFGRIVVPRGCAEYIYAFDIDWCMKREPPPLKLLPNEFRASLADEPLEEYRLIADRAWNRLEQSPVYEPLFP